MAKFKIKQGSSKKMAIGGQGILLCAAEQSGLVLFCIPDSCSFEERAQRIVGCADAVLLPVHVHVPIWKLEGLGSGSQGAKEQREDQLRRFGGAGEHVARRGKERSEAGRQRDERGERPSEISDG